MDEEYKPNSNLSKQKQQLSTETHKYDKVISGTAQKRPRNKFLEVFVQDDISNVGSHILMDVLVPALKKAMYDSVANGFKMILFGEKGTGYKPSTPGSTVAYHNYSESRSVSTYNPSRSRSYGYSDPLYESLGDAEAALMNVQDIIANGGIVSILDLYDMSGLQTIPNDAKYGWTDIRTAHIERSYDGKYILKMPRPLPID